MVRILSDMSGGAALARTAELPIVSYCGARRAAQERLSQYIS
jgi:hypothetical protein